MHSAPIHIFGDDISGPHSTAVIIGRNTVLACAHSLVLVPDADRKTRSHFKYLEDYWIQRNITITADRRYTHEGRIPITLYKFHVDNDWALLNRADGNLFHDNEIAQIDTTLLEAPNSNFTHKQANVLHCPVSLLNSIQRAKEYSIGCSVSAVSIQSQSTHHLQYEGRDLCRGSSGSGIFLENSHHIIGMHTQLITETEFEEEAKHTKNISHTDKRVDSDEIPYEPLSTVPGVHTKKAKSESDTVASLVGGNNGNGSAIILCKFPRLMHYIQLSENILPAQAQVDNDTESKLLVQAEGDDDMT